MPDASQVSAFLQTQGPLIDVRTPAEYGRGHIPGAVNLPLFSDGERAEVGTLYKQIGREAAVRRGLALVAPRLASLADALLEARAAHPNAPLRLHCWRGGLRSSSLAWLASTLALPTQVLEGGYKAYRQWVLALMEHPWPLRLLGGRTGTGTTALLRALERRGVAVIDLEDLAGHRGSSFGALGLPPQPSGEQFENRLAAALLRQAHANAIWLEAESAQVGVCRIPSALWRQMNAAPMLEVRRPLQERLRHLVAIYGPHDREALVAATQRIAKRLGPQRTAAAVAAIRAGQMETACAHMLEYYDRCYDRASAAHPGTTVDLDQLDPEASADWLLGQGLLQPAPEPHPPPRGTAEGER
ncbi:MAG: tRNA 2-selenouridine(34) synthase MnmH [Cyanobacteriota bacterium]